jgi:hypothetical protein
VALPQEPVTLAELAERLGIFIQTPTGERVMTRKGVHRLARAAWAAQRRGLLRDKPDPPTGPDQ